MTLFDLFEFTFRFALDASSLATWIWVIIIFIVFLFLIGSLWGRAWNRNWALTRQGASLALVLIFAGLTSYAFFNLRVAAGIGEWFKQQRTTLAQSISGSSRLKRDVIVETWRRLESKGGQKELTPPDQSGDQVRLDSPEDAVVLATVAAEETRGALRYRPPFTFGAPLDTKGPDQIATEAVDMVKIGASSFPRTVSSNNEWTATAAAVQTHHALDTAYAMLEPKLGELRAACFWLLAFSILIPVVFVSLRALDDIKVNPKP